MKSERSILIAFLLNLAFSLFEFFGGIFTNSVAIISDAVHDIGDAISIGVSYFLEKVSKRNPDDIYTYGYVRYSVMASVITTVILLTGSIMVIYNSILRLMNPVSINYDGMIIFAVIGVIVNFLAVYFTKEGNSLNQRTVNLHMIEDVLGWIVVLVGAIIMKFTNILVIDSILSIAVSLFIFIHALKNLKFILELFLEKIPNNVSIDDIKSNLLKLSGIKDVHHIHVWSIDGIHNYATMHIVVDDFSKKMKDRIRDNLKDEGIFHVTMEFESSDEKCMEENCMIDVDSVKYHDHHHH